MIDTKVSSKSDYGIRALMELACRARTGNVQTKEIATAQSIPEPYLDQLMAAMRRAGLVDSVRGAQGGFTLAKEPAQITVGDIIEILDGPISVGSTEIQLLSGEQDYARSALNEVWARVDEANARILHEVTLLDLVNRKTEIAASGTNMYYI